MNSERVSDLLDHEEEATAGDCGCGYGAAPPPLMRSSTCAEDVAWRNRERCLP